MVLVAMSEQKRTGGSIKAVDADEWKFCHDSIKRHLAKWVSKMPMGAKVMDAKVMGAKTVWTKIGPRLRLKVKEDVLEI